MNTFDHSGEGKGRLLGKGMGLLNMGGEGLYWEGGEGKRFKVEIKILELGGAKIIF